MTSAVLFLLSFAVGQLLGFAVGRLVYRRRARREELHAVALGMYLEGRRRGNGVRR